MSFIKITDNMTDEEKAIVNEANDAMVKLKAWKKLEDERVYMVSNIERAIKLRFPGVQSVSISSDSVYIETELHTNSVTRWATDKDINVPRFKCDVQAKNLPNTAEEFMEMKANIEMDKQKIMTAMNYILFRYSVKRED